MLVPAGIAAAAPQLHLIEDSLTTVTSTAHHRFLEFKTCSLNRCWSECYLQWFDGFEPERSILATKKIKQCGKGTIVIFALWKWEGNDAYLQIHMIPKPNETEIQTLLIKPGSAGRYKLVSTELADEPPSPPDDDVEK